MNSFVPVHLRKYIVPQNYTKYSSEDQAVWRFIMRGLVCNLSRYGCSGSLEGWKKQEFIQIRFQKLKI